MTYLDVSQLTSALALAFARASSALPCPVAPKSSDHGGELATSRTILSAQARIWLYRFLYETFASWSIFIPERMKVPMSISAFLIQSCPENDHFGTSDEQSSFLSPPPVPASSAKKDLQNSSWEDPWLINRRTQGAFLGYLSLATLDFHLFC